MSNNIHAREAVRVKVKKCEQNIPPEWRKFSVDPQITSLEVLYSLLAKAFDIKSDFSIKYKAYDPAGNETYLSVLSDWDLDAAFLRIHNISIQTATEPCLMLQIDVKPFTEVKDWDTDSTGTSTILHGVSNSKSANMLAQQAMPSSGTREIMSPLQQSFGASQKYMQHMQTRLPGLIMNHMEKTFSIVQKAFNLSEETMATLPPRIPLSDNEFRLFLDAVGQIQRSDELRKVIFFGGIDPSLRRVVWKHILNVYPSGMNGHQRMDYMRRKSENYYKLRDTWKAAIKQGCVVGELSYVTSMVKKDVLRTDRLHPFYAGSDDNQNIASLFNILTTYALNHPSVSYCQGMSDIASPLLVTMNDEAQAYVCFCAIMARVRGNFMLDGEAMTKKFAHLTEALSFYDPEFWDYLKSQQADDLLFCYRWLLLELKREFPFEDALRMLEVQWSSLKHDARPDRELYLYEKEFVPILESSTPNTSSSYSSSGGPPISPSYMLVKQRENPYTKVCALRRQSSSASLSSLSSSLGNNTCSLNSSKHLNQSLDDNIPRRATRRQRHISAKAHQSLDESKMLMLLEGENETKTETEIESGISDTNTANITGADIEDDVFLTNSSNKESDHFIFHPTNPFIEDAQCAVQTNNNETPNDQHLDQITLADNKQAIISKLFLNSSSSSPTEDDTSEDSSKPTSNSAEIPKGIAKLQNKNVLSNYNVVSNIIAKQIANATSVGESMKRVSTNSGGHFKDLKDKIAATSRRGLATEETNTVNEKSQQKLVKNFNEFLNFASANKNRIADKFTLTNSNSSINTAPDKDKSKSPSPTRMQSTTGTIQQHALVQLTKNAFVKSLDDSDSSSVPETTWSGSTAATAIQQTNNLSSNSLHLELNSLSSTRAHTPDKTPVLEQTLVEEVDKATDNIFSIPFNDDIVSTPDDNQDQEYYPMTTAITRELRLDADNLDRQVFGEPLATNVHTNCDIEYEKLDKDSLDLVEDLKENEIIKCPDISELLKRRRNRDAKSRSSIEPLQNLTKENSKENFREMWSHSKLFNHSLNSKDNSILMDEPAGALLASTLETLKLNPFIDESEIVADTLIGNSSIPNSNSLPEVLVPISTDILDTAPVEMATNATDDIAFIKSPQKIGESNDSPTTSSRPPTPPILPPPTEFGGGNPFLMFLCLTLLLQHRNTVMKSGMDYNEIAMHFDKMVRKHNVTRVLNQARRMYIDYLKTQNTYKLQQQRLQALNQSKGTNIINSAVNDINRNTPTYASTAAKS
ncbi:uncharacterized protein LOC119680435 [Teleopsis dalmanni]|uniref:uncharacterized protein LOC119680435 n=1 Tax=Teleopsis dalmanni TaxID=139649 RepID=UPI0018CDB37F|nr:uncharacterized protein LOC119680435 [Teleopsis dalmanni]